LVQFANLTRPFVDVLESEDLVAVDRTVAQLNVDHFRRQLATETDDVKRQMILRLLAEEEKKLAAQRQLKKKSEA
jgi:hypothetical protein